MKTSLLLTLIAFLSITGSGRADEIPTPSPASATTGQSLESLKSLLDRGDYYAAQSLYYQNPGAFTQEQRNTVALLVARSLVNTNTARTINIAALMFLNRLYEDRVPGTQDLSITTPDTIPCLIDALDLSVRDTGDSALILQILRFATRHTTGYVNGDDHFFQRNHQAVTDWWRTWWLENKNKHPVFDADLAEIIRQEFLKVDRSINDAKPYRWDSPDSYALEHGASSLSPVWYGGMGSGSYPHGAKSGGYDADHGDDVLCLHWEFTHKDLAFGKDESGKDRRLPGSSFEEQMRGKKVRPQEIYSHPIEGTGITIKVDLATTNNEMISVLSDKLNRAAPIK